MTSTDKNVIRAEVLAFLARHPKEQFKPRSLARRLGFKRPEEIRILNSVLQELYSDQSVARGHRKRYAHTPPPPARRLLGKVTSTRGGAGVVTLSPPEKGRIQIPQRFMGTALDGDTVSIALLADSRTGGTAEGEIVEIVERTSVPVVGSFEKGKNFFFVIPDRNKMGRDIYIPKGKTMGARPGEKVVAHIDVWESPNLNPEGHIVEILGRSGEVGAEMTSVAREFQLPLHFPKQVVAESEKIGSEIPGEEIRRRLDLRQQLCMTIDPEDAKDFDDAVSVETLPDGLFRIGVHIADVSHYVREGTALDAEAYRRGTSVYLADSVIPMLPERLSNGLCSLRPNEDRLTYSAIMTVDGKGQVVDSTIAKSVIHSRRRFTYEEVQHIIKTGKGDHASTVLLMHRISQTLLKARLKAGSIDFETTEAKFKYDAAGKPTSIIKKERLDAHRLVEDFMLLANQTVARHIGVAKREGSIRPFLYRIHDAPPPDKLQDLASFVQHLGYSLNVSGGLQPRALQKLLADVKGKDEEQVINEVAIRSMAKAVYSPDNIGHFGLGFSHYTHFTSPIRRYPDLVVHRMLFEYDAKMSQKRREEWRDLLPDICTWTSERERIAMEAERASVKVMQLEYMKRHIGDDFDAIISGVTNFGLFVEITDLLVEGLIRMRDMGDDYYVYDEKRYQLQGRKTKKRYRLGDKVRIRVVRVDPEDRHIDFTLID